jgi:hypothetical protein
MTRRPGTIYVGEGGSPIVYHLTWNSWGSSSVQATGKLAIWGKHCVPIVSCKPTVYKVTVTLTDVKNHNGTLSYRKMADAYTGGPVSTGCCRSSSRPIPSGTCPPGTKSEPRPGRRNPPRGGFRCSSWAGPMLVSAAARSSPALDVAC